MPSKHLAFGWITSLTAAAVCLPATAFSQGAFLRTLQPLDEDPRGYCLDVSGPPQRIRLDDPLQVHSCKYGHNNEDQLFQWRSPGQIHNPEYDVCLTAGGGGELFVRPCSGTETQTWNLTPEGFLSPASRPDLCVTLADERRLAGSPAWISPGYHARSVSLADCEAAARTRQQLRWSAESEQEIGLADQVGNEMPAEIAAAIRQITQQGGGAAATYGLYDDQPRAYEPGEIEVAPNISYGPHERNLLDVHTANFRQSDTPMPVVMYFHGGGFIRGSKEMNRNVADYFASLGLVGVNATYRLAPEAKWPDGANDIGTAVAWAADNIADYGGDPDQIFVIGTSAAADHAATYAFRPGMLEPGLPAAAGVILLSGAYDADTTNASEGRLAYFGDDFSRWPEISTIGNVERVDIPVMFAISEFDLPATQVSLARLLGEVTEKRGRLPRVVQLIGHNHYSPNPSMGTQDTQLTAAILEFVRSTAGTPQQMTAR